MLFPLGVWGPPVWPALSVASEAGGPAPAQQRTAKKGGSHG